MKGKAGWNLKSSCRALVFVFLVCGLGMRAHSQPVRVGPPYHIGIILPLTGEYEHIGTQILEALQLGLDESPGLTWSVTDTRGDPDTAAEAVRSLASNRAVMAIIGPIGAAESRAAATAAETARIPLLSLSNLQGLEDLGRYTFRLRVSPEQQSRWIARVAIDRLDVRRFAVLYPDDEFGRRCMEAFVSEIATSATTRVTAIESFGTDETNFNGPVELLVNQLYRQLRLEPFRRQPRTRTRRLSHSSDIDFQAVFIPDYHDRVGLLLPFLAFWDVPLGAPVRLLGLSSWGGSGLAKSEDLVEGALFPMVFHPSMFFPAAERFADRFQSRYERPPSEAEAQSHDVVTLLADALNALPSHLATREILTETLRGGAWIDGVAGPMRIDENGAIERDLPLFAADRGGLFGPYILLR